MLLEIDELTKELIFSLTVTTTGITAATNFIVD